MSVDKAECKRQLEAGFGSPELAAILRPVAMDPTRLQRFVELWNSNDVTSLGDIVTTQLVTESSGRLVGPQTDPVPLDFSDSEVLQVVRMTWSGVIYGGESGPEPIDPDDVLVDLSTGTRTVITSRPVPVSHIMGNGIDSWLVPVPLRLGEQQRLAANFRFLDGVLGEATEFEFWATLHCLRLTF